ncbi:LysE/ArgO family amino acid transporter [Macrococcus equipercicus]|uniref:Amino acid transporter n=1 Tax=Macrococcus equipercicus TaxID=69967 RepID=A0A9Q9BQ86_9STAP|nr:LysE/ArgO family amino acid transporter [Macrococcus equipercicus]KAA1036593.1 amino acid transporter [Macrococcus equipercicus]UTH13474.1 amino acid transporter [Macrococcus equipercicus]
MLQAVLHAFLLAIGLILPLGVQNIFVFNQGATQQKFARALPVILTAALCDTLLISLAVLGVSVIIVSMPSLQIALYIVGIIFLLYMSWSIWTSAVTAEEGAPLSAKKQVLFAMSVSLLNPHAIMDTVGVIGTNSIAYDGAEKWAYTLTCIAVSWLWFFMLAVAGRKAGHIDKDGKLLTAINKLSVFIILIVIVMLVRQLMELI